MLKNIGRVMMLEKVIWLFAEVKRRRVRLIVLN